MKVRHIVLSLLLALTCTSVFAHGGKTHVMGTIGTLDTEHIVVKDREGKTVSIRLTKDTKCQKGDTPAAVGDLKVGDRVVIDVTGAQDSLTATEIRFGKAPSESGHEQDDRPLGRP